MLVWNLTSIHAWRVDCNASAVTAASPVALLGPALAYPGSGTLWRPSGR